MPNTVTPFSFYLDAALFCKRAGLPLTQILRADWRLGSRFPPPTEPEPTMIAGNYVVTHSSGARAVVYAACGEDAITAYRKLYSQPAGNCTARLEERPEAARRESLDVSRRYCNSND